MIQNEREIRHEYVLQAVRQMMTAARTAPKGKGIDGCTAFGNVGRLQMCDGDSGKRVLEKPVLRSKTQNRVSYDKV